MSGPDRRHTKHSSGFTGGADPEFAGDEEYTTQIIGYRRAYHVQADVQSQFAPAMTGPATRHVQVDVTSDFKAREIWLPSHLADLDIHLDASDLTVGRTSLWPDRAGGGNDFISTGVYRPWVETDAEFGGEIVAHCRDNAGGEYDTGGSNSFAWTEGPITDYMSTVANPWTLAFVWRWDNPLDPNRFSTLFGLIYDTPALSAFWLELDFAAAAPIYIDFDYREHAGGYGQWDVDDTGQAGKLSLTQTLAAWQSPNVTVFSWTGSAFRMWVNGMEVSMTNAPVDPRIDLPIVSLGLGYAYSLTQDMSGLAGAWSAAGPRAAVYGTRSVMSANERASLQVYAAERWGI